MRFMADSSQVRMHGWGTSLRAFRETLVQPLARIQDAEDEHKSSDTGDFLKNAVKAPLHEAKKVP